MALVQLVTPGQDVVASVVMLIAEHGQVVVALVGAGVANVRAVMAVMEHRGVAVAQVMVMLMIEHGQVAVVQLVMYSVRSKSSMVQIDSYLALLFVLQMGQTGDEVRVVAKEVTL